MVESLKSQLTYHDPWEPWSLHWSYLSLSVHNLLPVSFLREHQSQSLHFVCLQGFVSSQRYSSPGCSPFSEVSWCPPWCCLALQERETQEMAATEAESSPGESKQQPSQPLREQREGFRGVVLLPAPLPTHGFPPP